MIAAKSTSVMLREQLDSAEVELSSVLTKRRMSLRELTRLKIGDILPIELPKQVPLCVEGIPIFTGEFGIANDRNAVKIIATTPPGARPRVPVSEEDL